MSTILITGGAGFIGSHTARRLLAGGHRIRVLDNFDPFYAVSIKQRNVETIQDLARSDRWRTGGQPASSSKGRGTLPGVPEAVNAGGTSPCPDIGTGRRAR